MKKVLLYTFSMLAMNSFCGSEINEIESLENRGYIVVAKSKCPEVFLGNNGELIIGEKYILRNKKGKYKSVFLEVKEEQVFSMELSDDSGEK